MKSKKVVIGRFTFTLKPTRAPKSSKATNELIHFLAKREWTTNLQPPEIHAPKSTLSQHGNFHAANLEIHDNPGSSGDELAPKSSSPC